MKITREWAMPSPDTFSIPPIRRLLERYLEGRKCIVDPFARNSTLAHWRNDLNLNTSAESHMDAVEWLEMLYDQNIVADALLLDPPYSVRQVSECYQHVGRVVTMADTQSGFYRKLKDAAKRIAGNGCVSVCCGWNSSGMNGGSWQFEEILLVPHGGQHYDTIVTVETLVQPTLF